jgi:hypothetical protein
MHLLFGTYLALTFEDDKRKPITANYNMCHAPAILGMDVDIVFYAITGKPRNYAVFIHRVFPSSY